jgi:hypothetical protein
VTHLCVINHDFLFFHGECDKHIQRLAEKRDEDEQGKIIKHPLCHKLMPMISSFKACDIQVFKNVEEPRRKRENKTKK